MSRRGRINVRFLVVFAVLGAAAVVLARIATRDAGNIVASHHPAGTNLSVRPLRDGRADGAWVVWYQDRFEAAQSYYARGAPTGTWRRLAPPARDAAGKVGQVVLLEVSYANGDLHGPFVRRASDGTILEQGEFAGGVRHGEWRWADEDGESRSEWWWRGHPLGEGGEAEAAFRSFEVDPAAASRHFSERE